MRLSRYNKNSNYATLANLGSVTINLTVPANMSGNQVYESTAYFYEPNASFRSRITGNSYPSIDADSAVLRQYTVSSGTYNVFYRVFVYRKDSTHVALCCLKDDTRSVTGSADTLTATVHFYKSPFEA